jgi:HK97 family phage prohead protease
MTKNKKEIRLLEVRATENEDMTIEGYAVVFESPATHGWTEIIDKKAFDDCDMDDVCMKYNHEDNYLLLARTRNKSLELTVDKKGLKIKAHLIDTTSNRDIYKSVQAGLLDKMSFCFTVLEDDWDYEKNQRIIYKIDKLFDVSVVDVPFYDTTEVFARSLEEYNQEKEKYERIKLERKRLEILCEF